MVPAFVLRALLATAVLAISAQFNSTNSYIHTILVTGENNSCEEEGNVTCCGNLSNVCAWTVRNSTAILLTSDHTSLNTVISFDGLAQVAIIGVTESNTVVECEQKLAGEMGAGIHFLSVQDITLRNVTFKNCGLLHNSTSVNKAMEYTCTTLLTRSALYLDNCVNVNLTNVHFVQSNGHGLTLLDTVGTVNISNCLFDSNTIAEWETELYPRGSGIFIAFTYSPPAQHDVCSPSNAKNNGNSLYWISKCNFTGNTAHVIHSEVDSSPYAQGTKFQKIGRGGGIGVFFKGQASNNTIHVEGCHFTQNSALFGGAMYVVLKDSTRNNMVLVNHSNFDGNKAVGTGAAGGGAVHIGLEFFSTNSPQNNSFRFHHCWFKGNSALGAYGGGVGIFSSHTEQQQNCQNRLVFEKCFWSRNKAQFGAAVHVSPDIWNTLGSGFLPHLIFKDCDFSSNFVIPLPGKINLAQVQEYFSGIGTFMVTGFPVEFDGKSVFADNDGTALYVTSSQIAFKANSNVSFQRNTGMHGGAISLIGHSAMVVDDNSSFVFINNTSNHPGAALYYQSIDARYSFSSRSCFIQYQGDYSKSVSSRNITFLFKGNYHTYRQGSGDAIRATSIKPCRRACSINHSQPEEAFRCIANFTFISRAETTNNFDSLHLSTPGGAFQLKENFTAPFEVIPGKQFPMPFDILDDLNRSTTAKYDISLENEGSSNINLGNSEVYMSFDNLTLYGHSGDSARLHFIKSSFRTVAISLPVTLQLCPPGFVEDGSGGQQKCICSAAVSSKRYKGITECNASDYRAHLAYGFWIGYLNDSIDKKLVSSYCPFYYCSQSDLHYNHYILLPNTSSKEELDRTLCGKSRTGYVCGSCSANYSVYFHSHSLHCGRNTALCRAGPVFYILSELLPLTLLFLIVMVLNISFTSGAVNGFILFAQVFDSLTIDSQGLLLVNSNILRRLISSIHFIYRLFNLEFFIIDSFSFCLWEGTTALQILTIKYVTVIYGLFLVVATVLAMKYCSCFHRFYFRVTPRTIRSYVIHGLSTFLVMCYTQVATVSFSILTPVKLYAQGHTHKATVSAYQGTIAYFGNEHLPYALLAITFLATFVALPPLLLLVYPLHYRVLTFLHLGESEHFHRISRCISIARLKPFLDSFQSCFKDNFRFFAGLYFIYRMSIHGARVLIINTTMFYTILELELLVIITLHSLSQPYHRRWHNVLDALLFSNMAVINGLTLYNYCTGISTDSLFTAIVTIQVILVYLPLLYMISYVGLDVVKTLMGHYYQKRLAKLKETCTNQLTIEECDLPYRMLSDESLSASIGHLVESDN